MKHLLNASNYITRKLILVFCFAFIFLSGCKRDEALKEKEHWMCCVPPPNGPLPLYVTFWDAVNNRQYLTVCPDSSISFFYKCDSIERTVWVHQKIEPTKYLNKLDLSWANGPSIDSNMKVYYLRFRNGDTDTLYINYVYDQSMNNNCNCVYPLRAFLYNSQVPKYDSILKVYVINK